MKFPKFSFKQRYHWIQIIFMYIIMYKNGLLLNIFDELEKIKK